MLSYWVKGHGEKARSKIVVKEARWKRARQTLEACLSEGLRISRTIFDSNLFKWDENQWLLFYSTEIRISLCACCSNRGVKFTCCNKYGLIYWNVLLELFISPSSLLYNTYQQFSNTLRNQCRLKSVTLKTSSQACAHSDTMIQTYIFWSLPPLMSQSSSTMTHIW